MYILYLVQLTWYLKVKSLHTFHPFQLIWCFEVSLLAPWNVSFIFNFPSINLQIFWLEIHSSWSEYLRFVTTSSLHLRITHSNSKSFHTDQAKLGYSRTHPKTRRAARLMTCLWCAGEIYYRMSSTFRCCFFAAFTLFTSARINLG